jgi:O-antigen ligase
MHRMIQSILHYPIAKLQHLKSKDSLWQNLALVLTLAAMCSVPWSTSLPNLVYIACLIAAMHSQDIRHAMRICLHWNCNKIALGLIAALAIAISYSPASLAYAYKGCHKIAHKLLVLILLPPLFTKASTRQLALNSFVISICIIVFLQDLHILQWIDLIAITHKKSLLHIINPIPFSVWVAFAAFICCHRLYAQQQKNYAWIFNAGFLTMLFHFTLFMPKRTGLLSTLALALLFIHQRLNIRFIHRYIIFLLSIIIIAIGIAHPLQQQLLLFFTDIIDFFAGQVNTSIGLRMSFILYSVHFILAAPWIGHGTGSFMTLYAAAGGPQLNDGSNALLGDPHNTYLHLAVQLGIVGLCLFIAWLKSLWQSFRTVTTQERWLLQGLWLCFTVSCFCIDGLFRSHMGMMFVILMAIMLGARLENEQQR